MTTTRKPTARAKPSKASAAEKSAQAKKDKLQQDDLKAKSANSALFASAILTKEYGKPTFGEIELQQLHDEIKASNQAIQDGNLNGLEAMLLGQAKALQSMFVNFARRANSQEYMKSLTTYTNLALKAQSQSRATIQALVELKHPRQVIVTQQANITHGNQQVNNGVANDTRTREEKIQNEPNKLMESNHDDNQTIDNQPQRLDRGAAQSPIASHTTLEAVAQVNRGKDS